MDMLNINKWITFMLQNQYFEIMEETNRKDQSGKPTGNPTQQQTEKPDAGSGSPAMEVPTTKAATTSAPNTTGPKTSTTRVTRSKTAAGQVKTQVKKTHSRSASGSPAKPSAEGPEEITLPSQGDVPGLSTHATEHKSKKLEKARKKLKIQKIELESLETNRDRLMKDLISAIEKKKKRKKIRNLARDFNRIEIRVKNKTANYMKAKKKLAN
jgi:hypothetical protein